MAARVATQLQEETTEQVELVKGGLGEFSVYIDSQRVMDTNRLWYPKPSKVVRTVKSLLAK